MTNSTDYTGATIYRWRVEHPLLRKDDEGHVVWRCRCMDCGTILDMPWTSFYDETSCPECRFEATPAPSDKKDLVGRTYSKLYIEDVVCDDPLLVRARCACGHRTIAYAEEVVDGRVTGCEHCSLQRDPVRLEHTPDPVPAYESTPTMMAWKVMNHINKKVYRIEYPMISEFKDFHDGLVRKTEWRKGYILCKRRQNLPWTGDNLHLVYPPRGPKGIVTMDIPSRK